MLPASVDLEGVGLPIRSAPCARHAPKLDEAGCFGSPHSQPTLAIWPLSDVRLKSYACAGGQAEESEKDAFRKTMPIYRQ